jgi:hypothetical protein
MQVRTLHTGDVVYFTDGQTGQLLFANGFTQAGRPLARVARVDEAAAMEFPQLSSSEFRACLFKVTTELHYAAQEAAKAARKSKNRQTGEKPSRRGSATFKNLGRTSGKASITASAPATKRKNNRGDREANRLKYLAEEERNRNHQHERKMIRVYNDEKVQFRHQLSGEFLSMSDTAEAGLDPQGGAHCAFSLSSLLDSTFRTRDAVMDHDDVNLLSCKSGSFLNEQLKFPKLQNTAQCIHLRVHIYSPGNTYYGSLRIGQSIRIVLAASTEQSYETSKSFVAAKPNDPKSLFLWPAKDHLSSQHPQNQNAECIFDIEPQPFHLDHHSLETPAGDLNLNRPFRLCHAVSGKYLVLIFFHHFFLDPDLSFFSRRLVRCSAACDRVMRLPL